MTRWKQVTIISIVALACLTASYLFGYHRSEQLHQRASYFIGYYEVNTRIKTLDLLYRNETEKAIHELERGLDMKAITFGPNEYHPRQLTSEERSILQMISKHRELHPFTQPDHPGINDMVHKSLQSCN
jgi:hypothetical protein